MSQMSQDNVSNVSAGGNTRNPRCRSKRWCFTLNNYTEEELSHLSHTFDRLGAKYILGLEVGDSGTPHVQGYVEFKNQKEFASMRRICPRWHLEKAKGSRKQNIAYCSKQAVFKCNLPLPRRQQLLAEYDRVTWRSWQRDVLDTVALEPNSRDVHWYWEGTGNVGKSYLARYLVLRHNAVVATGKTSDIMNQVKLWLDENPEELGPRVVLIDVPRSGGNVVNYHAIENLKNGFMYSGKYEGGVCVFKPPHVIVFANNPPAEYELSADRWNVNEIASEPFI